ncbi:hypothetical protein NDN08_001657 [Rhodosorus marinus]|uniref:thioredoxin-dependent peroxiredoxin n=1 Tax=Rhodosorus marinus TaxID=101924 RepID=A0AAV8UV65_9RHOD|nr:hypothetical protein NDN08_001657 [Rhodosorus marinus]
MPMELRKRLVQAAAPKVDTAPAKKKKAKKENSGGEEVKAESSGGKKGKLSVGSAFPAVKLEDQDGKEVDLNKVAESHGFVLFVYPRASTPGCTKQACGFRDNHQEIVDAGYQVFGISSDKPKSQMTFKTKQNLPYSLLADPTMSALKALGVAKMPKSAIRSHFIVGKGGVIEDIKIQISPADSVAEATAFVTEKK